MSKYGLLGKTLKHSYSKLIHEKIYHELGLDNTFDLIEIEEKDIINTLNKLKTKEYLGFNVTIPYKEIVIKYLDELSLEAKKINAVNTIKFENNKLIGYNTDYYGLKKQLEDNNINPFNKKSIILGSGGASKASYQVLKDLNSLVYIVSRNNKDNNISYKDLENIEDIYLIINATPVGMFPNINESPIDFNVASKADYIVDLIYNPSKTKLMTYNNKSLNGLEMLVNQAVEAFNIWTNLDYRNNKLIYEYVKKEINYE